MSSSCLAARRRLVMNLRLFARVGSILRYVGLKTGKPERMGGGYGWEWRREGGEGGKAHGRRCRKPAIATTRTAADCCARYERSGRWRDPSKEGGRTGTREEEEEEEKKKGGKARSMMAGHSGCRSTAPSVSIHLRLSFSFRQIDGVPISTLNIKINILLEKCHKLPCIFKATTYS